MMKFSGKTHTAALALAALAMVAPLGAMAQDAASTDGSSEARLRRVEAEVRALQRQVFPGGDGKFFAPQVQPSAAGSTTTGTPASTPVSDLLGRMDAVEAQLARLTAQNEENTNKLAKLEAKVAALAAADATPASGTAAASGTPVTTTNGATAASNLAAMTGGGTTPAKPATSKPAETKPAVTAPTNPSAQRLAAVRAIAKPQTADAGDDEYSYGFRLWEAKFYPEAEQQLKLFLERYPRHARISYARNLLGRAYLDEGKPRDAAQWFLQNYQAGKSGDRAPDSLLYLAESMRLLKDTNRACVALAQFTDDYPREAAGRLKTQYDATRAAVKCN